MHENKTGKGENDEKNRANQPNPFMKIPRIFK